MRNLNVRDLNIMLGLCFLVALFLDSSEGSPSCSSDEKCGWKAVCQHGKCNCVQGYSLSKNKVDCVNASCEQVDEDCLECSFTANVSGRQFCRRCMNFIEEGTGQCLLTCPTRYTLVVVGELQGRVCARVKNDGLKMMYIAIIIGTSSGVLLTILLALVFYFKFRTDRERDLRIKLMGKMIGKEKKMKLDREAPKHKVLRVLRLTSMPRRLQHCVLILIRSW